MCSISRIIATMFDRLRHLWQSRECLDAAQWIVASDSLYALHEDWLLQEEDIAGALDLRTAMVPVWNELALAAPCLGALAGEMQTHRFASLCAVAEQLAEPGNAGQSDAPHPGRFGLVESCGMTFVSGTRLVISMQSDVRHAHRHLYTRFSRRLRTLETWAPAASGATQGPGPSNASDRDDLQRREAANMSFWRRRDAWRGAGLAAGVLLAVAVPLGLQCGPSTLPETQQSRSEAPAVSSFGLTPRFMDTDIYFSRAATLQDAGLVLLGLGAGVVTGPSPAGAWRIAFDQSSRDATIQALNASSLVTSAEPAQ